MKTWGLGEFIKFYVYNNWLMYRDTFILISGIEGSGKSNLAINLADYIDKTFRENMINRLILTEEDIPLYDRFFLDRAKRRLKEKIVLPEAIIIDEGQNLLFSRTAMNKEQKEFIKKIRTQRFALATVIINLPNLAELDKSVISRADIILIPDPAEELVYGYFRKLRQAIGSLDYFIEQLFSIKNKRVIRMEIDFLREIAEFDFQGKKVFNKELYLKYEEVKILKSMSLFKQEVEVAEEKEDHSPGIKLKDFSTVEYFNTPTPEFYKNCYYTIEALSKMLKIPETTLRRKIKGLNRIKKGRYYYYLLEDVYNRLFG